MTSAPDMAQPVGLDVSEPKVSELLTRFRSHQLLHCLMVFITASAFLFCTTAIRTDVACPHFMYQQQ
jgi:hypothetical protein